MADYLLETFYVRLPKSGESSLYCYGLSGYKSAPDDVG